MERRPLFAFGAAYFAGAFAAGMRPWQYTYIILAGAPILCLMYAAALKRKQERLTSRIILILLIASVLPAFAYRNCVSVWKARDAFLCGHDEREVELTLKISSSTERSFGFYRAEAKVLGVNDAPATGSGLLYENRILLSIRGADEGSDIFERRANIYYGVIVKARGKLLKPSPQQNEYLYDRRLRLYSKGIAATLYADAGEIEILSNPKRIFGIPLNPIGAGIAVKENIETIFYKALPEREAALMTALLVGRTDGLDSGTRDDFKAAGMFHLTAVSGLHVIIVAGLAASMLRAAGLGIKSVRILTLVALLAFAFVAGFSPSVIRASLMYAISSMSKFTEKSYDSPNALGLAAIAILSVNPMQAFDAGFLLSFSATASICVLLPLLSIIPRMDRLPRPIYDAAAISLAVSVGCFPVQASIFNGFSTVSPITNAVSAPIVSGTIASGLATAAFGAAAARFGAAAAQFGTSAAQIGTAAAAFGSAASILASAPALITLNFLWLLEKIAETASRFPGSFIKAGTFTVCSFFLYYLALFNIYVIIKRKINRETDARITFYSFAALLLTTLVFIFGRMPGAGVGADEMEVVFLDVGNANAAYVNIAGKYHVVVDAGGAAGYLAKEHADESRLCEYLAGRGIGAIDLALVTHGDSDHTDGFWNLLDNLTVRSLAVPDVCGDTPHDLAAYATARGVEVVKCGAGDAFRLGDDASIDIVAPERPTYGNAANPLSANDESVVSRIAFGGMYVLFCGDIGARIESEILERMPPGEISSQLMCVPHHGSKYSSTGEFLSAVSPQAAVACVGKNGYGHPAAESIERYEHLGARFLRTDRDGMVTVLCGRDGIIGIKCYNDDVNKYAWQRAAANECPRQAKNKPP